MGLALQHSQHRVVHFAQRQGDSHADRLTFAADAGTYNAAFRGRGVVNKSCDACPAHTTTFETGGRSTVDCNVCDAGWGQDSQTTPNCLQQCGNTTGATFGTPGRAIGTVCEDCPAISTGFYFAWASANQPYKPGAVAPPAAESRGDCLAQFGQVGDTGAWYVGGAATLVAVPMTTAASSFDDCAAECSIDDSCEYITYDYKTTDLTKKCFKKLNSPPDQQYAGIG